MTKVLLVAVWLLSLLAWTPAWTGGLAGALRWVAPLMLVAHVVEFFVFREVFEKAGGSMVSHFFQTLVFGVFYINPLKEQVAAVAS